MSAGLSGSEKMSMAHRWKSFVHFRVREWSTTVTTGALLRCADFIPSSHPPLTQETDLSLTWLCLLPLSAAISEMVLLAAALGVLCALTSLFASIAYMRRRHLLEHIVKDEVGLAHWFRGISLTPAIQGAVALPLNIWIFLSLPSLYLGWSLLLLGLALLWSLCVPRHHWGLSAPEIALYITGVGIPLLLIPCRLVVQNFQSLS